MSDIQRPESAARHNAATGLDVDDSPIMDAGAPASISKNDDDVQPGGAVPTIPPTTSTTTIGNAVPGATTVDLGFIHGFIASLSVILVSELGDKTFFIAAIMAMRHPRLVVFAGAIGALGLMTVLSGKHISSVFRFSILYKSWFQPFLEWPQRSFHGCTRTTFRRHCLPFSDSRCCTTAGICRTLRPTRNWKRCSLISRSERKRSVRT